MHRPARRPTTTSVRPQLEPLDDRLTPTVQYFGGNLLPHVEAQAVYLGSQWSSVPASGPQPQPAALDAYLTDLTGGAYMDALTRAGYNVGRGTATAGAIDPTAYAANTVLSDMAIRARIQTDINSGLLQAPDANRLYVVYVQPNVAVAIPGQGSTQHGVLGYHGAFNGSDAAGHPAVIRYAVVAYPGGTVGNSSLGTAAKDQLTAVTSHELAEAATDPDVNLAKLGWYDSQRGEIGDITENNPNALVRLDGYLVQEVADRNDQLLPITVSTPSPPPPPVSQEGTTTTLTAGPVAHLGGNLSRVTLTVKVSAASGSALPGGTVKLVYNGAVLGTATIHVVNGVAEASFHVYIQGHGSFTFAAQYAGSGWFQGSASGSVTVTT